MSIYQLNIDFNTQETKELFQVKASEIGELKFVFRDTWFLKTNVPISGVEDHLSTVLTKKDYFAILPVDSRFGMGLNTPENLMSWLTA